MGSGIAIDFTGRCCTRLNRARADETEPGDPDDSQSLQSKFSFRSALRIASLRVNTDAMHIHVDEIARRVSPLARRRCLQLREEVAHIAAADATHNQERLIFRVGLAEREAAEHIYVERSRIICGGRNENTYFNNGTGCSH